MTLAVPATIADGISTELWYSVAPPTMPPRNWAGSRSITRLRVYAGSLDDVALNAGVKHFSASPAALTEIQTYYQTRAGLSSRWSPLIPPKTRRCPTGTRRFTGLRSWPTIGRPDTT